MSKNNLLLLIFLLSTLSVSGQQKNSIYLSYIEKYAPLAVAHRQQYGIPASITLAQALLESQAGQSELAARSNNHFGIKCNNWAGKTVYYEDDEKQASCFRRYASVIESYEDHALFLKNRSRYAPLFQLGATNYKAWAKGLVNAGYATDAEYAEKLVRLIDTYGLHTYDSEKAQTAMQKKAGNASFGIPATVDARNSHIVYDNNGVDCIVVREGDTYGSIGEEFEIAEIKLRRYNDDSQGKRLAAGKAMYLKPKKKRAAGGNSVYTVKAGDTMYAISQKFAIKIERLYRLNKMDFKDGAKTGQTLKLR